ncbi:hypothetical protein PROFUN_16615, partial [Planoprotostelium fungivorum]
MGIVNIHPGFSAGWLAVTFMYWAVARRFYSAKHKMNGIKY